MLWKQLLYSIVHKTMMKQKVCMCSSGIVRKDLIMQAEKVSAEMLTHQRWQQERENGSGCLTTV